MVQILIGVALTGGLLYVSQFAALAGLGTQFLMAVSAAAILWALATVSAKKDQWVFLRHINNKPFTKVELAAVAFGVAILGLLVLHLVYNFQIPTLVVTVLAVILWKNIKDWVKDKYDKAREKRLKAMEEYQKNPPISVTEQIKSRLVAVSAASKDAQEDAMDEVAEDYVGL